MHGDQPKPNATPATTGAAVPKPPSCGWKRFSWYSHGARRNSEPSRNSAIANITAPERRVRMLWWSRNSCPKLDAESPSATKIVPKPATNNAVVDDDAARVARAIPLGARRGRGR